MLTSLDQVAELLEVTMKRPRLDEGPARYPSASQMALLRRRFARRALPELSRAQRRAVKSARELLSLPPDATPNRVARCADRLTSAAGDLWAKAIRVTQKTPNLQRTA